MTDPLPDITITASISYLKMHDIHRAYVEYFVPLHQRLHKLTVDLFCPRSTCLHGLLRLQSPCNANRIASSCKSNRPVMNVLYPALQWQNELQSN